MAKRQHVIELNGQKYDALTGKQIAADGAVTPAKHVDGFVRRKTPATQASRTTTPQAPAAKVHRKPQKSQTLMRTAVKKPVHHKIHAKAPVVTPEQPAPIKPAAKTTLVPSVKPERILRATNIAQSALIRKFGSERPNGQVSTAVIPVRPAPQDAPPVQAVAAPISQPAPTPTADSPFDKALELANSHFEPRVHRVRLHHRVARKLHVKPRSLTAASLVVAALAIGGFWAYQSVPNVAMRIARTRSGVNASLPGYQPAGFGLDGPITASAGQVSVNYHSNSDNRAYTITQRSTDWNSQSLLDNFINTEHKQFQSMQVDGRTIYLYDGGASWVDGGIWYQISGDSDLNGDQILRIVDSL